MWISKREYNRIICRIEMCEKTIFAQEERINKKIREMAKKILEEPKELSEEIGGLEDIERFVNDFISD